MACVMKRISLRSRSSLSIDDDHISVQFTFGLAN